MHFHSKCASFINCRSNRSIRWHDECVCDTVVNLGYLLRCFALLACRSARRTLRDDDSVQRIRDWKWSASHDGPSERLFARLAIIMVQLRSVTSFPESFCRVKPVRLAILRDRVKSCPIYSKLLLRIMSETAF
jgi:hypothetical protein